MGRQDQVPLDQEGVVNFWRENTSWLQVQMSTGEEELKRG